MTKQETMHLIDGLLFIFGEDGLKIEKLKEITKFSTNELKEIILEMEKMHLSDETRASFISIKGNQINLVLKDDFNEIYYNLKIGRAPKLSDINLEVLTIIAYEQPISKNKINTIRGLNSDSSVNKLLKLKLIEKSGVDKDHFNATLYKTSNRFLEYMKIDSLDDLPNKELISAEVESSLKE